MEAKTTIEERLERIENLLLNSQNSEKEFFNVDELADYLNLSKSTIYKLTHRGEHPYSRPNGKRLYFHKKKIDEWIQRNSIKTNYEIETEVITATTLK